ncbi:methionine ABC transporter ATP-binding protein [Anaerorhabdus sp.]|uniref:methionine ABC transporter ATP-binding protein n=1 Tax=Anaerorhabdus sp. TaxID=1872524 RepID=UPI002B20818E|nr:methionine ABC transporter ATP-binding protein [Anaerorhabdus sp.]MEA4874128.1 methionine ABC transporter ATP-binding protein [Anaerorhabdus sp.]
MIQIQDVVKTFSSKGEDIHAVRGVNLEIYDGEIFGIIGYSGAGKSTLVRIINQLEKQSSGKIIIDGEEIENLSSGQLRKKRQKIGMIFQHFNLLWSRTVEKNIAFPLEIAGVPKEERKERVQKLIRLVGLEGREKAFPSELSGGQKQRVGIARALANNPSILLCDEATSALDPETTDSILELLNRINREYNITMIVITHQMEVVQKLCHKVAVMSEGKVVELGTVKEIFEHPQNDVTKRFVQTVDGKNIDLIKKELKKLYPYGQVMRLNFTGDISNRAIIADVIRQTKLPVSIVNSNITHSQVGPMGVIYAHVSDGSEAEYKEFSELLEKEGVKVDVL